MKKKGIIVVFLILFFGLFTYKYLHKEHRNVATEKPIQTVESNRLYHLFQENNEKFNAVYLDKTIEVYGKVTMIDSKAITLDINNYIIFKDGNIKNVKINDNVTVKGRFVGYDDLLDQLKIDQAILITN